MLRNGSRFRTVFYYLECQFYSFILLSFFLSLSNKSKYIALLDQNIRGKKFVWAVSHLLRNKEPEKKGSFVITMIIFSLG